MNNKLKWYSFDETKGSKQKRPPIKKYVLVLCESKTLGLPDPILVGWRKDAAGDKQSPYFVRPGSNAGKVIVWCDCLPDNFDWPRELSKNL